MFRKSISICFACFICFALTFTGSVFAATLDGEWKNAMKEADGILKKAKMGKLSKFVKFDKKFVKNLKYMQGVIDNVAKEYETAKKIDDMNKSKRLKQAFEELCKKEFSTENWEFYSTAALKIKKNNFEEVYNDCQELNLPGKVMKGWEECKEDGFEGKRCKDAFKLTYKEVKTNLSDTFMRFKTVEGRKLLAGKKAMKRRDDILKTVDSYKKVLLPEEAPDAKKVLITALEDIEVSVKELKQIK